ncbi:MAG TPA: glutamyl-tRNA reductase [Bacteroidia bacterium]|nr:glutamyl-tRNA reductase [Bacteroidia bacterium]
MNRYATIAFTHHSTGLKNLDGFFIDAALLPERLKSIKEAIKADGLMYLATCNRLEFIFSLSSPAKENFAKNVIKHFHPEWKEKEIKWALGNALVLQGEEAVKHIINVASSLDSLVVGEREIITQVRQAYEWSQSQGLTDDFIRILIRKTIETAKKVYTDTKIADKPVSVMSLACRKLQEWNVGIDSRIVMIGAGQTADIMVKYLSKHGFTKFTVFNRTLKHAKELADKYKVDAHSLKELETFNKGFDVLITCAQSSKPIISSKIFDKLANGEKGTKMIVDLGLPFNVDKEVLTKAGVKGINVDSLNGVAKKNLNERKSEMVAASAIINNAVTEFYSDIKSRKIEIALREVPERIHEMREKAVSTVFLKEIEGLSSESKLVLEKVIDYMEKKCISIPMQVAKEKLLDLEA